MCQKKPGPRCAAHVRTAMEACRIDLAENREAMDRGEMVPHPDAAARMMQLQDEFDETPTGQHQLAAKIHRATDPAERSHLRRRKTNAANRYTVRKAAAAALERGDERGSLIIQRTQIANTAWLAHSALNPLKNPAYAKMRIADDGGHMLAVTDTETIPTWRPDGTEALVEQAALIYETPLEPGPEPDSYRTHAGTDRGYLYRSPDIDHPYPRLHHYDADTAHPGPESSVHDMTAWPEQDSPHPASPATTHTQIAWEDAPDIVTDQNGTPILARWHGTVAHTTGVEVTGTVAGPSHSTTARTHEDQNPGGGQNLATVHPLEPRTNSRLRDRLR